MDVRYGTCSDCGSKFKIPATFKPNRAKCKKCGGVVEIEPAAPAASPAADGDASAARPVPARKPAAKPAAPKAAAPRSKPAAPKAAAAGAKPGERAGAKAGASSSRRSGSTSRRSGARAGRGKGADDGEESAGRSARRRGSTQKKKSNTPALIGIAALIVVAIAGWYLTQGGEDGVEAGNENTTQTASNTGEGADGTALDDSTEGTENKGDAEGTEDDAADDTAATEDDAAEDDTAAAEDKPKPKDKDPSEIDLASIPDFGPAPGTSDEEWEELQAAVAAVIDPDSGILGSRGRTKLEEAGHKAMPAILNGMKTIDYGTEDGMRSGDRCQQAILKVCNGINFGWKYEWGPNEEWFNRRVVELFVGQWIKCEENIEYWIKMAKLDDEAADALRTEYGASWGSGEPAVDSGDAFGDDEDYGD